MGLDRGVGAHWQPPAPPVAAEAPPLHPCSKYTMFVGRQLHCSSNQALYIKACAVSSSVSQKSSASTLMSSGQHRRPSGSAFDAVLDQYAPAGRVSARLKTPPAQGRPVSIGQSSTPAFAARPKGQNPGNLCVLTNIDDARDHAKCELMTEPTLPFTQGGPPACPHCGRGYRYDHQGRPR